MIPQPSDAQYSVLEGPFQHSEGALHQRFSSKSLDETWDFLFSQPLERLLRNQETGLYHKEHMQWQIFDHQNQKPVLAVFSDPPYVPDRAHFVLVYNDPIAHTTRGSQRAFGKQGPIPGVDVIQLAKVVLHDYIQMQPAYYQLATAALEGEGSLTLEKRLPYHVAYDSIRVNGPVNKQGSELHYFPTLSTAMASMLNTPLDKTATAQQSPDNFIGYTRIALLESDNPTPLARIVHGEQSAAYLLAYPALGAVMDKAQMQLQGHTAFDPTLQQVRIGSFSYPGTQKLDLSRAMKECTENIFVNGFGSRDTPYQVNFHYPPIGNNGPDRDFNLSVNDRSAANALHTLLDIRLNQQFTPGLAPAHASVTDGTEQLASIEAGKVRLGLKGEREGVEYRLHTSDQFWNSLPPQVRGIVRLPSLQLCIHHKGQTDWTDLGLQMKTSLTQYLMDRQKMEKACRITQFESHGRTQPADYYLEVQSIPKPQHYKEQKPVPVIHRYPLRDWGAGIETLAALSLEFFDGNKTDKPIHHIDSVRVVRHEGGAPLAEAALHRMEFATPQLQVGIAINHDVLTNNENTILTEKQSDNVNLRDRLKIDAIIDKQWPLGRNSRVSPKGHTPGNLGFKR